MTNVNSTDSSLYFDLKPQCDVSPEESAKPATSSVEDTYTDFALPLPPLLAIGLLSINGCSPDTPSNKARLKLTNNTSDTPTPTDTDTNTPTHTGDTGITSDFCNGKVLRFNENPITIYGEQAGNEIGKVAAFTDATGDGVNDIVLGAPHWSSNTLHESGYPILEEGKVYLFEGGAHLVPGAEIYLADVDPKKHEIIGSHHRMWLGSSLAVSKIDSDNVGDIVAGAQGYNSPSAFFLYNQGDGTDTGAVFNFYGRTSWESQYPLEQSRSENIALASDYQMGMWLGASDEQAGQNLAAIGDFDGDGAEEQIYSMDGTCNMTSFNSNVGVDDLATVIKHTIRDPYYSSDLCANVSSGNIDGDANGWSDLVFSTENGITARSGHGWILFGTDQPLPQNFTLPALDTPNPALRYVTYQGIGPDSHALLSAVGNMFGQTQASLLVGAYGEDHDQIDAGAAHMVPGSDISGLGNADHFILGADAAYEMDSQRLNGKMIHGTAEYEQLAYNGVDILNDTTCPQITSIAVGAGGFNGGTAYIFDGGSTLTKSNFEISSTNAAQILTKLPDSNFGQVVYNAGDVNGDGVIDLAVSANAHNYSTGALLVFLGELQ